MTATNELDAILSQEDMPDEFSRLASSSPPGNYYSGASLVSGLVPNRQEDGVMCPLMLRRRLIVPVFHDGASRRTGLHV